MEALIGMDFVYLDWQKTAKSRHLTQAAFDPKRTFAGATKNCIWLVR